MRKLLVHLEHHLGTILHGWNNIPYLQNTGIQVAQHDSKDKGCNLILSTAGLSCYPLQSRTGGGTFFQELIIFANKPSQPHNLPGVLGQITQMAITSGWALRVGDILGPNGPILQGSKMEAFFVTLPKLWPPEFASVYDEEGRGIALLWLLPITAEEAFWAQSHGWDAFDKLLEEEQPDLLDWYRPEISLHK